MTRRYLSSPAIAPLTPRPCFCGEMVGSPYMPGHAPAERAPERPAAPAQAGAPPSHPAQGELFGLPPGDLRWRPPRKRLTS